MTATLAQRLRSAAEAKRLSDHIKYSRLSLLSWRHPRVGDCDYEAGIIYGG